MSTFPPASAPLRPGETPADQDPARKVRLCAECGRPLTVGERMFYFLDALHSPALCRVCLAENERASWQVADLPIGGRSGRFEFAGSPSSSPRSRAEAAGDGRYYPFFEEYLADVDAALAELPRTSPLRSVSLRLRGVAVGLWESGEFTEGLRVIRRLWSQLGSMNLIPANSADDGRLDGRVPPTASEPFPEYDESLLEPAATEETTPVEPARDRDTIAPGPAAATRRRAGPAGAAAGPTGPSTVGPGPSPLDPELERAPR